MAKLSKKSSSRKRNTNRSKTAKYVYSGDDPTNGKAYAKTGRQQRVHIILTGNKYDSEEMGKLFKKNRRREIAKSILKPNANNKAAKKKPKESKFLKKATTNKERIISTYNQYDKKYRTNSVSIIDSFKIVESSINKCHLFVKTVKRVIPAISKVVAFVRLTNDGRKLIISLININGSINELIDIATTEENIIVSLGKGFEELVDIVKETKEIYDTIEDVCKQVGIIFS